MNSTATEWFRRPGIAVMLCLAALLLMSPTSGLAFPKAAESMEYSGEADPIELTDVTPVGARRRRVLPFHEHSPHEVSSARMAGSLAGRITMQDEATGHSQTAGLYPLRQ